MSGQRRARVSVLIPSYDHGPYIEEAVRSALDQTERDIEVLVLDDGSTDDSVERVRRFSDPRLRIYEHPNRGLSRTLNRGLELAGAPWVKFLPSDDALEPDCLARQAQAGDEHDLGLVFSLPKVVDAGGRPLEDPAPQAWFDTDRRTGDEILPGLIERNFLCAPGALFSRGLALEVGGFDPELVVAQDYDLWLKLLPRCRAELLPDRLVRVRWHGENQSGTVTPATEAERSRVLRRSLEALGLEEWEACFARAAGGEGNAREALAAALVRSDVAEVRSIAEMLRTPLAATGADEGAPTAGAARGTGGGAFRRLVRRALVWARRGPSSGADGPALPPVGPPWPSGPRTRVWAVVGEREAVRRQALEAGLRDAGERTVAVSGLRLRAEDSLVDRGGSRPIVVVTDVTPEATAIARGAAAWGARIVFDPGPGVRTPEQEDPLLEVVDDLVAPNREAARWMARGGRMVHQLADGEDVAAWAERAASTISLVEPSRVAIVLISDGPPERAAHCLAEVVRHRGARADGIAVVETDASPEGALTEAADAARAAGARVDVFRSPRVGAAAARNLGWGATTGDVVVFLDGAWVPTAEGWLEPALRTLRDERDVGLVAYATDPAVGGAADLPTGPAAGLLVVPRAVLRLLRGFDEAYDPGGFDALDLGLRIERSGGRVDYDPALEVGPGGQDPAPASDAARQRLRRRWA